MPPVMQARVSLFPPLPLMPLFEVGFDLLFPLCADGCRAGCLPHPGNRLADNVVVDRHALCVILKPHSPVGRDAEAGSLLHGIHVGTKEQKFPAVPFFFPLDHPANLLVAKPLAGVFQPIGGDDKDDLFGTLVLRQMALDLYVPHFRANCETCGSKLICNGCSDCGKCL